MFPPVLPHVGLFVLRHSVHGAGGREAHKWSCELCGWMSLLRGFNLGLRFDIEVAGHTNLHIGFIFKWCLGY